MQTSKPDDKVVSTLKRHEGFSAKAYRCPSGALSIGYGHNLDAKGITKPQALYILIDDINEALEETLDNIPCAKDLSEDRLAVLVMMTFNLGITGLLTFKRMLAALERKDYQKAASEMLNSRWCRQVKGRAHELAEAMLTGEL